MQEKVVHAALLMGTSDSVCVNNPPDKNGNWGDLTNIHLATFQIEKKNGFCSFVHIYYFCANVCHLYSYKVCIFVVTQAPKGWLNPWRDLRDKFKCCFVYMRAWQIIFSVMLMKTFNKVPSPFLLLSLLSMSTFPPGGQLASLFSAMLSFNLNWLL